MIDLEKLKPILETLLDGREDGASIIEQVAALDEVVEVDNSAIDELNANHKAEIDALNTSWNDRYMKAFFGEKAENINTEIPTVEETEEVPAEPEYTYDSLFTEVEDKKEED